MPATPAHGDLYDLILLSRRSEDRTSDLAAQLTAQERESLVQSYDSAFEGAQGDGRISAMLRWIGTWRQITHERGWIAGEHLVAALLTLRLILGIVGVLLGVVSARILLHYDGGEPVNVLVCCAFLFGVQFVLLITALVFLARSRGAGASKPSWFLRLLAHRRAESLRLLRDAADRWTAFSLSQFFGLAFSAGALLTSLYFIVFTDLTFAWSSTLDPEPALVHGVTEAVALPWKWISSAVPTLEVVEASRWSRAVGAYATGLSQAEAIDLARRWWSFLVAGLVFWGIVPRLIALTIARWASRRQLESELLNEARLAQLAAFVDRLRLPPSAVIAPVEPSQGWVRKGFDKLLGPVRGGMRVARGTARIFRFGKRKA